MGRRARKVVAALAVLAAVCSAPAYANNQAAVSEQDCASILAANASAPKTVPASLVRSCEELIALAPAAGAAAASSPADPCSGPSAGASVYCWGAWSALAPAAGDSAPDPTIELAERNLRPEMASAYDPNANPLTPDLPLGTCTPGATCGYATAVTTGAGGTETTIVNFELSTDGTSFIVSPGTAEEIQSATMVPVYTPRPDEYENVFASGVDGSQTSLFIARVLRSNGTDIDAAADIWIDSNGGVSNTGNFAWGIATSQADLDSLSAGVGTVLNFAGVMSGDISTTANITLNLSATPTWTGNWTNPGYAFSAAGAISGADFISDSAGFSSNVQGGFVQGGILGPLGGQAVTHAVDVTLDGVGSVRDVGLLVQQP